MSVQMRSAASYQASSNTVAGWTTKKSAATATRHAGTRTTYCPALGFWPAGTMPSRTEFSVGVLAGLLNAQPAPQQTTSARTTGSLHDMLFSSSLVTAPNQPAVATG